MHRGVVLVAFALCASGAFGMKVGAALERPAPMVRNAEQSVLLGVAQAGERLIAVGERGLILLSDNGGQQWRQVAVPVSVTLTTVRFADPQHGIAVGHGGTVLVTADGGQTWKQRLDGVALAELLRRTARASGDAPALAEAERLVRDGPDKPLFDVVMLDASRALVVGAYGLAFYTADGGLTWTSWMERMDNPKRLHLHAVRVRDDVFTVAGEQGLVLRSDVQGRHFRRLSTPYAGSYFTLEVPAAEQIVLGGLRGNVWHSSDDGASWSRTVVPGEATVNASTLARDGTMVMVDQYGRALTLNSQFEVVKLYGGMPPATAVLMRGSTMIVATMHGLAMPVVAGQRASSR